MNNSTKKTNVVSDVSVNTYYFNEENDSFFRYKYYNQFYNIKKRFLNFPTKLYNGLIDIIEMGNYFNQENFSVVYYFNHSGLRMNYKYNFTSLNDLNDFLKRITLNSNSSELYLTWSKRRKIPVLVSY